MVNDQHSAKEEHSYCIPKKQKNLLTRRNFITAAVGIGAVSVAAADAKKKEDESKMPVWTGDLKSSVKQTPRIPVSSKPNGLNMIVIIADTWRADHLGCYGSAHIKTPYLDKLAKESVLFTDATAEGLPTIPCRRVYHTGKSVLPEAKWQPLADSDITFAEVLQKHGVTTGFIVDTYHHFKANYNFHRGFDSWQWVRGQETDRWKSGPKEEFDPKKHMPAHLWNKSYDANMRQYMMNTQDRKSQEDYFCARSCRSAMDWLEQNAGGNPFMLWIDMFDPHEPWDAPLKFQKMYRNEYPYERYLFGYGVRNADIRPEDLPVIRDLYAAEVTFSDYCIGHLLKRVEQLGLMENTIIVFSTDHGTHLGEEGCVQKTPALLNACVTRIPLIIKHPDNRFAGKRVDALVSAVDFMPTFLPLLGIDDYKNMDGQNMWPLVTGEISSLHENVYTVFNKYGAIHNLNWHYFQNVAGKNPGKGPCLYDLKSDPEQTKNVIRQFPKVAKDLRNKLQSHLKIKIPPLIL
ncbi:MAG: sulfatase [Planctomycetes bacterium]|nr:sulfatase [Planctomycetota bacterium]MBL7142618.1 sulfatase [Phycisphaerae bacterium]